MSRQRRLDVRPALDARSVFYGRPLLEFVARETFAALAGRTPNAETEEDDVKRIHAAWLLTARDDLGGRCPREVAIERHQQVSWDLQMQLERWSFVRKSPPGLDESSHAFRYSGFGTHELVLYYDLVRTLLWSCRDQLGGMYEAQETAGTGVELTLEDFLTSEVARLDVVCDSWLNSPESDCHGRTPRSVIDRERARLPEVMSRHEAIIDPDCPCCQMAADLPGPMFWGLDGCNMDEDFAFDFNHATREGWEAEQRSWEEHRQRFNAEMEERERMGVTRSGFGEADSHSVWSSTVSIGDSADLPLGIRLFEIGGHLAELIVDLRGGANRESTLRENQHLIDQLNRDFGNLREVLQSLDPSAADSLIEPVINRFTESLQTVASVRPDLDPKCKSLSLELAQFLEPPSADTEWDADDLGIPF